MTSLFAAGCQQFDRPAAVFSKAPQGYAALETNHPAATEESTVIRGQSPVVMDPAASLSANGMLGIDPLTGLQMAQAPGGTYIPGQPLMEFPAQPLNVVPDMASGFGDRWDAYLAGIFRTGDDRTLGQAHLFAPLYQSANELFFLDVRGMWDDGDNSEGNFGIAHRVMTDPGSITGFYGFYDYKRTRNDNTFDQITLGTEFLTYPWEARINGYIPLDGGKPAPPATALVTTGNGIFMGSGVERSYWGFDGEFGWLLAENGFNEIRAFVGGFHFDTSGAGFENVSGPRVRLESRSYDIFGGGSRMTLGVEYQWDQVRDDQVNFLARFVIPLAPIRAPQPPANRMRRRMLDRIIRDDDIITVSGIGAIESVVDVATGTNLSSNTQVVRGGGMDVVSAAANSGATNIVVDGGTYTETGSVPVADNQNFFGGGMTVRGTQSGQTATFGSRPTINGTDNTMPVFMAGDVSGVTIRGFDITGGSNGIQVGNISNSLIADNNLSGYANDGLNTGSLTGVTIRGNTATGPGGGFVSDKEGFQFGGAVDAASSIINNTASMNGDDGFQFDGANSGTVSGNTASGNTDGFLFFGDPLSGATATMNDNMADNNRNGFSFGIPRTIGSDPFPLSTFAGNEGSVTNFTGNTATNNNEFGFLFVQGGFNNIMAPNNVPDSNTATGNGTNNDVFGTSGP